MKTNNNDLFAHWCALSSILMTLIAYVFISHQFGHTLREPLPEDQRVVIRSVFYGIAIVTFPLTSLIRHIQLTLNKTLPGKKSPKSRYLGTVIVSMVLVESVGLLGFVMFVLGDDFNTLYIFTSLAVLGLYLYRPKMHEYDQIVAALSHKE